MGRTAKIRHRRRRRLELSGGLPAFLATRAEKRRATAVLAEEWRQWRAAQPKPKRSAPRLQSRSSL
jgi:hypothetical protein